MQHKVFSICLTKKNESGTLLEKTNASIGTTHRILRYRELLDAAKQRAERGSGSPLSSQLKALYLLHNRRVGVNGSPAVTTGRHSSDKSDRCRKEGIFIPNGVVPRKLKLSSLTGMSVDGGFFIVVNKTFSSIGRGSL